MIRTVDIDVAAFAKLILNRKYEMINTRSGKVLFDIDMTEEELDDYYDNSPFRSFKEEIDKTKKRITNRKRERDNTENGDE